MLIGKNGGGYEVMKKDLVKKGIVSMALTGSFIVGAGLINNANAQDPRYDRRRPVESTGNIDRNRNGIDDRYEVNGQVDRNQNGIPDNQERYGRYGRDQRYNGNRGYNNGDFQRGYRDGLSRGRDDARTNRAMTPNNSDHYRSGNPSYRAGFERGFYEAYRANRGRRW
jgi:hypothetical protein